MIVGSLIKKPRRRSGPIGGYICGTAECVERCAYRLSAPGLGQEVGANLGLASQSIYQGFFLAPNGRLRARSRARSSRRTCMSGWASASCRTERSPATTSFRPSSWQRRADAGLLPRHSGGGAGRQLRDPGPWAMPGYDSEVVMAAGAFVQGSSIELSADGPIRPPYAVYFQGGLTWYHAKLGILMSLQKLVEAGLAQLGLERIAVGSVFGPYKNIPYSIQTSLQEKKLLCGSGSQSSHSSAGAVPICFRRSAAATPPTKRPPENGHRRRRGHGSARRV